MFIINKLKLKGADSMKYKTVIDGDGVITHYPILTKEQQEAREQRILRLLNNILEKHDRKKKEMEKE